MVPLVLETSEGTELGEDIVLPAGADLELTVRIPSTWAPLVDAVYRVDASGNTLLEEAGSATWTSTVPWDEAPDWIYVAVQLDGGEYYGEAGCDDGGVDDAEWLWGSPSRIMVVDHDDDGDGYSFLSGDCDDTDRTVYPGAREIWYDGRDQNCDGEDDYDADADGFPSEAYGGTDCDDRNRRIYPGRRDRCGDGIDSDCDGRD